MERTRPEHNNISDKDLFVYFLWFQFAEPKKFETDKDFLWISFFLNILISYAGNKRKEKEAKRKEKNILYSFKK